MRSFLTQPYPFSDDVLRKLAVCGGIGVFVTLFLAIFQPFGIGLLPAGLQWLHSLLFGLVTVAVSSLFQIILPKIFPLVFKEEGRRSVGVRHLPPFWLACCLLFLWLMDK